MKIARRTKEVIDDIKAEAANMTRQVEIMVVRLEEHPGTKRVASRLDRIKEQLESFKRAA